ncbi:vitamin B12-dependent ribonucleotide reductase [Candidatus Woesearchaeota archaeon]|nr:vitamin B12-dependent ribonucleotide reductase [Candidatus Woesearchaeota archaeon]
MASLNLPENSLSVLTHRYLLRDDHGKVNETPEQLFRRVAKNISLADKSYGQDPKTAEQEFYKIMSTLDFMPNSPTLMNAGNKLQQLAACFVLPVEDSMSDIYDSIKHTALIHQSGGGTGFNFSHLRPKNDLVHSTKGVASGPVSFMKVFNASTEVIKQGGKRRGANMGILNVDHPDIMEFITCKEDEVSVNNFNLSVALTDTFMQAVKKKADYDLLNPRYGKPVGKLNAREVFDKIVDGAWRNGEPGIIFIDRINKYNPTPKVGRLESTNPCGEQPLLPYESCNLGSINLSNMVKTGKIDFDHLGKVTWAAVHFLDNVIDMNNFPLKQIEDNTKANRKIGMGVMGFADMLIKLGIPYNSEKGVKTALQVMKFVRDEGKKASTELAKVRGNFTNYDKSVFPEKGIKHMRNATVTTIAPTGTISMIANASSGIEPFFSLVFRKNVLEKEGLLYVNELFEEIAKSRGFYSKELMEKVADSGSIQKIEEIPADVREVFVTSHDISPEWHVKMQAAFQKYTDNAVSKTINFPNSATKEDIENAYMLAYDQDCKGLTVYRDGSRSIQVIDIGKKKKEVLEETPKKMRERKNTVQGITNKVGTGCGSLYVTINEDEEGPLEVFARLGRSGGCAATQTEAIGRLISLAMQTGIRTEQIVAQLEGIRCPAPCWQPEGLVLSCPDAIAKAIKKKIGASSEEVVQDVATLSEFMNGKKKPKGNVVGVCPDCSGPLIHEEGCSKCHNCGFSKCG